MSFWVKIFLRVLICFEWVVILRFVLVFMYGIFWCIRCEFIIFLRCLMCCDIVDWVIFIFFVVVLKLFVCNIVDSVLSFFGLSFIRFFNLD